MIPQETADLADALQAEFPDISRDEAISKANRLLAAFKAKGWKVVEVIG